VPESTGDTNSKTVEVSVAICVKNREGLIEACLRSVLINHPAEIIVVDCGSTDGTVEIARRYAHRVLSDGGRGLAFARQLAAEEATQPYVSYVDSDVVLTVGSLAQMLHELQARGYAGIHAQLHGVSTDTYWAWAQDQHYRLRFNKEGVTTAIGTAAAIFDRETILRLRFDPMLPSAEDGDLCRRLRASGQKVGISSVSVFHQHRASFRGVVRQMLWYGQGTAHQSWKHRSARILFPALFFPILASGLALVRGRPRLVPYFAVAGTVRSCAIVAEILQLALKRGKSSPTQQ
jgi:glycosyltransferase involved in cell wall biosynthesis